MPRQSNKPYRDGRVHVAKVMCKTCIFRPGNLMNLAPGRRDDMVAKATLKDGAIPCHETSHGKQSVCRGFFDRHATAPLQIADRLKVIEWT